MIASGAPLFMALWGVPFVLVGLYIMAGRFWVDAGQRAATVYAVTSERVVIVSGVVSRRVKSLSVDTLSDVSLTERAPARAPSPSGRCRTCIGGTPGSGQQAVPSFDLPRNTREVYETIRQVQRAAKQHA